MLETIIQLPNNQFYNTGITTYIWILSNNKEPRRQGRVQLIDASGSFGKLRKNLGNKNCELKPEHIRAIQNVYNNFYEVKKVGDDELAVQIFDNSDFGYYKVAIERPSRTKAQFTDEAVAQLRFDKTLNEPMTWAFATYGEHIYSKLPQLEKEVLHWCEKNDIDLAAKKRKILCSPAHWEKHRTLMQHAQSLQKVIGSDEHYDFNVLKERVEVVLKAQKIRLSASEKNAIHGAITCYDETAEKVVAKKQKLSGDKLNKLLHCLECTANQLPDFGYYPSSNKNEYIIYQSESDLRDSENVPLKESIYEYLLREVKPHVDEAWIDLEKTKIGYEVSFNKYFYQHKPLRSIEEVGAEILALEKENEGLIMEILNLK